MGLGNNEKDKQCSKKSHDANHIKNHMPVEIFHNIPTNYGRNKRRDHKDKRDGGHDSRELIFAK